MSSETQALRQFLLPLSQPPSAPGWNQGMLKGIRPRGRHVDAAVLLALRDGKHGLEMLFTRRTEGLSQHPGQVSFPGGRTDPGDANAAAAAIREAHEEIALPPEAVEALGYLDCLETISGYCVTPVVARVIGQPDLQAQPDEVAELFSVPLDYLLDSGNYGQRRIDTPVGPREISEIHHEGHIIWGATALILTNLRQRMGILP
ncbi:MAG: CoA pyrophosphatase [Rhodanobacteraceae bacterium]